MNQLNLRQLQRSKQLQAVLHQWKQPILSATAQVTTLVLFVGLCLEFVRSLCRTYDITIAALPLYSVIALRAQLSLAVKW